MDPTWTSFWAASSCAQQFAVANIHPLLLPCRKFCSELYSWVVKHAGFNRDRFLVLSAPRLPGFVWSDKKKTWIADTASPPQSLETGYAIKQLAWPEQAYSALA